MLQAAFIAAALSLPTLNALAYSFPDCTSPPLQGNAVCDTTKDPITRASALIKLFTPAELAANTVNVSPGVPRLGIPSYQWWSEALHGVAGSPGVSFAASGNFSYATSFPQPITMSAAFHDSLIKDVASVISTEARAFNNFDRAGIDFFTPNINPFRDPRWGRGQETPGEDPFRISQYVFNLIQGLQGGIDPEPFFKVGADCKHFAAYDIEDWEGNVRYGFNAVVSSQELSEFYLPPFQSCVRDAKVASVMCSYNAVNGVPSCANDFLLQTLLRDTWGFGEDRWVTSDCDAISNIFVNHNYTATITEAAAVALKAGTDLDCGTTYSAQLPAALNQSMIDVSDLQRSLTRQYASLVRLGYFDPAATQPYRQLDFSNINTPQAQQLAYQAAVEGIVLLKNDGTLPMKRGIQKLAIIGPWANATNQMQGNYAGTAPFLISPVQAAKTAGFNVSFTPGTTISGNDTSGFAAAVAAAKAADMVIFAGGIDNTIEAEAMDRTLITWPGNQLDLVKQLETVGKPLVVLQFGGGQVDSTVLKQSPSVNALIWGGYPGQSGGTAIVDILRGKAAPAGRLPLTQYPASYISVPMTDMSLRPSATNPGRTYKWFTGTPVFEFGHGLHFTTFTSTWQQKPATEFSIQSLFRGAKNPLDLAPFTTFKINVQNTGHTQSDYVALLFANGTGGPAPHPNKELVSYTRLQGINPGQTVTATLPVTLGSIARADVNGNMWVFSGTYTVTLDTPGILSHTFKLTGKDVQISIFPQPSAT
ncbi:glycoside hydrolase family 3 protein [Sphaerobolus stellatus SS14]|uniref:xylan 1,4-beta-xylosidase n=1 Tax=Sphaerobolus stellatus (strain SS14) TaxID=990650 RepID=A0A0C9UBB6_SPHS4|nr:glycoside hydrolase family 3 protein [Sphaerobolus stellatus SS14]